MSIFLGIDIGTSGTKTVAIDSIGQVLAEATETYPCHYPRPLWSEQDPNDWWTATVATVRAVVSAAGLKPDDVTAIGLSGQMHGAVFLDRNNKIIRQAILWNDQRTTAECKEIEAAAGGRRKLLDMVANPALTGFTAPKILWLRKNEPSNFQLLAKVLLPKDEIRRRLTGEFATDVSDASGTLLLDVKSRKWCGTLLSKLKIDQSLLPECFESCEVTGTLSQEAAKLLGLTTKCVVVAGAGDCPAGAIGNGIVRSGVASTIIGTSSVVLVASDEYKVDGDGRIHTFCHAVPGKWMMLGVNLAGGGCLQWFRNQLCKGQYEAPRANGLYELLTQEAAAISAGCQGLVFLPYLSGERSPHNDPDARGCFIGLSLAHGRGHMVRAIMEGVAYNMNESLSLIKAMNIAVDTIRVSGGGSKSALWRQIQADSFGQAVETVNCEQGPAYGAALLAAVGARAFSTVEEACQVAIKVAEKIPCLPENAGYYRRGFSVFQRLYRSLEHDFKLLSNLDQEPERSADDLVKSH